MQQQGIPMKDYTPIFIDTQFVMPRYTNALPSTFSKEIARPAATPSSPKTSGHDTVLRAIQNKGAMITIKFLSGENMTGTLVARDQYTLTVRTPNNVRNVVFKSAIKYFSGEETATDKAG